MLQCSTLQTTGHGDSRSWDRHWRVCANVWVGKLSDGGVRSLFLLPVLVIPAIAAPPADFLLAARSQIGVTIRYDGTYAQLDYPGGDVPMDRGVCTDVVLRAMRKTGFDLQRAVHEDMKRSFSAYPRLWGLRAPDRNIDHRRVPNLARYLERRGKKLPVTNATGDYLPGDFVTCIVPPHLPHIMIVSDRFSTEDPGRPLIIHNIGNGAQEEDRLFEFKLTGHYRWW
jgi:uncharacterized protein